MHHPHLGSTSTFTNSSYNSPVPRPQTFMEGDVAVLRLDRGSMTLAITINRDPRRRDILFGLPPVKHWYPIVITHHQGCLGSVQAMPITDADRF